MKPARYVGPWVVVAAAATLLAVTMGSRSSFGLFVSPLNTATGLGVGTIGLAVAISQLAWGVAQPVWGAFAERHGTARVIALGCVLLATTSATLPFVRDALGLTVACAAIAVAGAAAGSNALLLGEVSRRVAPAARGLAIGVVSAGGSAGQLVLGPTTQAAISGIGWQNAMLGLAVLALCAAPLAWAMRRARGAAAAGQSPAAPRSLQLAPDRVSTRSRPVALRDALSNRDFWCVAGGFFVCGFHVAFLSTHMPGVIELCGFAPALAGSWLALVGLFNIGGSIGVGFVMRRASMTHILSALYALRALGIVLFVVLPKSESTVLAFGVWVGLTYMATLPPTSGLVAKLFGVERLASLLGVVMLVHQLGAFLGAWIGGAVVDATGGFGWVWAIDVVLAGAACLVHFAVREASAHNAVAERAGAPDAPVASGTRPTAVGSAASRLPAAASLTPRAGNAVLPGRTPVIA